MSEDTVKSSTVGSRIKEARSLAGLSQEKLGGKVGKSDVMIGYYERGKNKPGFDVLSDIAKATGVRYEWLKSGKGEMHGTEFEPSSGDGGVDLPVHDVEASMGDGTYVVRREQVGTYTIDRQELIRLYRVQPNDTFVISVIGDSMDGTLSSGQPVLVEKIANPRELKSDGIYFLRLEGTLMVKRLQRLPEQRIRVISDNEAYPNYEIHIDDGTDFEIIGRVMAYTKAV